ncbi:MAG: GntR family transcriptional regulator [Lachnospiraceae bacterium]|nr:GntR family transcriptional regulator [Lachnospiraceae bacterium]
MAIIDYQDGRPIYEQIVDYYKHLILIGALEEDTQMPSVRNLAMELSTNPNTVQKAFMELERQGFIYTVKGRGNFVRNNQSLKLERESELENEMVELLEEANRLEMDVDALVKRALERTGR